MNLLLIAGILDVQFVHHLVINTLAIFQRHQVAICISLEVNEAETLAILCVFKSLRLFNFLNFSRVLQALFVLLLAEQVILVVRLHGLYSLLASPAEALL